MQKTIFASVASHRTNSLPAFFVPAGLFFEKVVRQTGCLFINGCHTPGLDVNTMTADGLHLDAAASEKLVEPVVKLMMKLSNQKQLLFLQQRP